MSAAQTQSTPQTRWEDKYRGIPEDAVSYTKQIHSPQIEKIAFALAKAQGEMRNAPKDSENPYFHSKYAGLDSIMDVIRTPLADNEICHVHFPDASEPEHYISVSTDKYGKTSEVPAVRQVVTVHTRLIHSSGQWFGCTTRSVSRGDNQGVGTGITYLKRYNLAALCDVATEDDDGNASLPQQQAPRKPSMQEMKARCLATLEKAADESLEALQIAWNDLHPNMRAELQQEKDRLKQIALEMEDQRAAKAAQEVE